MSRRKAEGFVRELHGDLHLGNVAEMHGKTRLTQTLLENENVIRLRSALYRKGPVAWS